MIPAYIVVVFLLWADVMWVLQRKYGFPFFSVPLIHTLAWEALLYISFSIIPFDIELRAILVRFSIVLIAFSMAFPLTLGLFLHWRKHHG